MLVAFDAKGSSGKKIKNFFVINSSWKYKSNGALTAILAQLFPEKNVSSAVGLRQ